MKCQEVVINPFELDRQRSKFAKKKDYKGFLRLYSGGLPELKDTNTGTLWDSLNLKGSYDRRLNPMAFHRIDIVSRMIPNNIKVLDVGFGSAILERRLLESRKCLDLYGIDISSSSVRAANEKYPEWVFKTGNILEIPFKNNFFDCVLALEVLEHIQPSMIFNAFKEIYRVLKADGNLIISVPLNEGLEGMVKKGYNPNAHLREYTPEILKAECYTAGFNTVKKEVLFAFNDFYFVKSFIAKYLLPFAVRPNNLIVLARKK